MNKIFLFLSAVFCLTIFTEKGFSQLDSLLLLNSREIDLNRYKNYEGSPYIFKDFVPGNIIFTSGDIVTIDKLNYNGHGHSFEFKSNGKIREIDPAQCLRAEIPVVGNKLLSKSHGREKIILQKGIHPNFRNRFIDIIYLGENIVFFKDLFISIVEEESKVPGEKAEIKKFNYARKHYLMTDGELKFIRLKKKPFLKVLGKKKELEKFIKDNNTIFKSMPDVITLLKYYDKLIGL